MSVESKLTRLSLNLQNVGLSPNTKNPTSKQLPSNPPVADSWEDDASEDDSSTEADNKSYTSDHSVPMEAPGPTHLKSPTTKAIEAERELSSTTNLDDLPNPPPPTPISPSIGYAKSDWPANRIIGGGSRQIPNLSNTNINTSSSISAPRSTPPSSTTIDPSERKRPEKTTSTANRLIAGALGIKAPPKTEEQRKYDRAVREAEIKRRNKEKESKLIEEEENRRAKDAVWEG